MTPELDFRPFHLIAVSQSPNPRSGLIIRHHKRGLDDKTSQNQQCQLPNQSGPHRERTRTKNRAPGLGRNGGHADSNASEASEPAQKTSEPATQDTTSQPCPNHTTICQDSTDGDTDHATPWVTVERPASTTVLGPDPRAVEDGGRGE